MFLAKKIIMAQQYLYFHTHISEKSKGKYWLIIYLYDVIVDIHSCLYFLSLIKWTHIGIECRVENAVKGFNLHLPYGLILVEILTYVGKILSFDAMSVFFFNSFFFWPNKLL